MMWMRVILATSDQLHAANKLIQMPEAGKHVMSWNPNGWQPLKTLRKVSLKLHKKTESKFCQWQGHTAARSILPQSVEFTIKSERVN